MTPPISQRVKFSASAETLFECTWILRTCRFDGSTSEVEPQSGRGLERARWLHWWEEFAHGAGQTNCASVTRPFLDKLRVLHPNHGV
jgi:hypothetical protein